MSKKIRAIASKAYLKSKKAQEKGCIRETRPVYIPSKLSIKPLEDKLYYHRDSVWIYNDDNKNIPASKYDNMHPDYVDYSLIDPPLRNLVKIINNNSWAKTIGSCGGRACHKDKGFYLIIEVKGIRGIRNFLRWLSLSHALGIKARYESNLLRDYALPMAEIVTPNLLHSDNSNRGALMGKEWIRFHIRFYLGGKLINRAQTRGGIKALELGWSAIKNNKIANSKVKYRREL